jgi:hypothetical protein
LSHGQCSSVLSHWTQTTCAGMEASGKTLPEDYLPGKAPAQVNARIK